MKMFTETIMTAYYLGLTRVGTLTAAGAIAGGIIGGVMLKDDRKPEVRDTIFGTIVGAVGGGCLTCALMLSWPVTIPIAGAVYPIQKYKEYEYKRQVEATRSNLK